MTSFSVSDYKRSCDNLVRSAIRRPAMFYRSLQDFEAYLDGHLAAFQDLAIVDRDAGFHEHFGQWIYDKYDEPTNKGWANAIENLANARGVDSTKLFAEFADEFLKSWVTPST